MNTTDKIEIEQIAQAVWDKLKDEYLRRDGSNFMQSDLGLNNHNIKGVKEIRNIDALPIVIAFNKDGYDVKLENGKQVEEMTTNTLVLLVVLMVDHLKFH